MYNIYLQEELLTTIALGSVLLVALTVPILAKIRHAQLLRDINRYFDDEYLTIEVVGKNIKVPNFILTLFFVRKKEFERLLKNRGVVLVFNKDAYKVLKSAFNDIEIFKILGTGKKLEYTIDEFVKKYMKYFGTFGDYRMEVNIESILNIFSKVDLNSLPEGAVVNLVWIGSILRQLVLYGKDYGVEKVIFKAKKVSSTV